MTIIWLSGIVTTLILLLGSASQSNSDMRDFLNRLSEDYKNGCTPQYIGKTDATTLGDIDYVYSHKGGEGQEYIYFQMGNCDND